MSQQCMYICDLCEAHFTETDKELGIGLDTTYVGTSQIVATALVLADKHICIECLTAITNSLKKREVK